MKKCMLLLLAVLIATASVAKGRDWKPGTIVITSQTDVSWPLWGEKDTMHYTIETYDMIYFVEYTFKPSQHSNSRGPDLPLNVLTKIAIEGKHAYIHDVTGKEVKLQIVKKTAKQ